MQYLTITFALAALTTLVTGSAIPTVDPTLNATVAQWSVLSKGVNVTLFGTASEVIVQLKSLDPDWTPVTNLDHTPAVHSADTFGPRLCCPVASWNWPSVQQGDLGDAAQRLMGVKGTITVQPNTCALAECYEGAGIWVCDDMTGTALQAYNLIVGQYAQGLADNCPSVTGNYQNFQVCGQQFDKNPWNVIVHAC